MGFEPMISRFITILGIKSKFYREYGIRTHGGNNPQLYSRQSV